VGAGAEALLGPAARFIESAEVGEQGVHRGVEVHGGDGDPLAELDDLFAHDLPYHADFGPLWRPQERRNGARCAREAREARTRRSAQRGASGDPIRRVPRRRSRCGAVHCQAESFDACY
jgi:hypothetical protein